MDLVQGSLLFLGFMVILGSQNGVSGEGETPALQCHQCQSIQNADCGDEFTATTTYLNDCPADGKNYTVCRKIKQDVDGEVRVTRQCGTEWDPEKPCVDRTGSGGIKVSYCECKDAGCNSAPHVLFSLPAGAPPAPAAPRRGRSRPPGTWKPGS